MILANTTAYASYSSTSLLLGVGAALAYVVPSVAASRMSARATRWLLWCAWGLHGSAVLWSLLGLSVNEVPRFGFAPALSITAWLVLTVYAIESHMYPKLQAVWAFAGLGALAVLLALVFPGQALHSAASPWLPLHWALGLASYGLFAAAVVHAWLMMRAEKQIRLSPGMSSHTQSGLPLLTLERLTFRFVLAGFVLLTATLLAGWWFSEVLYGLGKAWKWDHKTIFSVLAWVAFAVLLVGRAKFGWRGRTAVRVLYAGSGLLLLAYVGSRFVLEVVLGRSL
ncbi:MAG: cytochrome c biogenesis protein CcsA [Burkholderiaceae bacterium]|nr:cytochrome c biogenesis protein CcsA [Burkholderiaceae bacterium]